MRLAPLAVVSTLLVALAASAQTPPAVPFTAIQISGGKNGQAGPAVTYRAYQAPGEPYRIVCQEPCAIAENLIFAAYEGFRLVRPEVTALMGIGIRPELLPYDIHLNGDSYCGPFSAGLTGDASRYSAVNGLSGVASCFWEYEKSMPLPAPYVPTPFTVENLLSRERQLLRIHEYGHGLLYGRHESSYEDVVKALSFSVAGLNGVRHTDACDPYLRDFSQGRLVYSLCRAAGFQWSHMAPALQEMDRLFGLGLGTGNPNNTSITGRSSTSTSQLRERISQLTGRDATDGVVAAGYNGAQAGGSGVLRKAGGVLRLAAGQVTLGAPVDAVAVDTTVTLSSIYSASGAPPNFAFGLAARLSPESTTFAKPVRLTFVYEPIVVPSAVAAESLRLYRSTGSTWVEVPGTVVDPVTRTASALVPGLGLYALAGPSQAPVDGAAAVVATVASAPGLNGSYFRTQVQLHNPGTSTLNGRLVFHPREAIGTASDPGLDFSLRFRETKTFPDVFAALSQTGSGSLDVVAPGAGPVVVTRVFNDGGVAGTAGVSEEALPPGAALKAGQRGVLLAPTDVATQRMNVGIRTLAAGASFNVTVRSAAGAVRKTLAKAHPGTFYFQQSSADFLEGLILAANDSLEIAVTAGNLLVYGATADNSTNDPSLQLVRFVRRPGRTEGEMLTLPTVASTPGQFGSFFRTALQLHNPEATPASGTLVFHPAGRSASASDPALAYTLAPYETKSFADLLPALGQSGSGSVDVTTSIGSPPLVVARVYNDGGAAGTTGLSYEALSFPDALAPGQRGILLAPPSFAAQRMNVGVRTLSRGANVTILLRSATGTTSPVIVRDYPPDFFEQKSLADFLEGRALTGNESIEVTVEGGALFLYGAIGDNLTNDPTLQLPGRATF